MFDLASKLHTTVGWLEQNLGCREYTEWLAYLQPGPIPSTLTADQQYAQMRNVLN